ncbi:MAG TPA: M3 family metallopeptidase, partial [Terrimicrobiaceae bacterium]
MSVIYHTETNGPARSVPHRSEVRAIDTWDLTPLYPDDESWERDFSTLQAEYGNISIYRGKIAESAQTLREALEFEKSVDMRIDQLNQYASLRIAEDSSNDASLSREARLDSLRVRVGEAYSFLAPEIQEIPDEVFSRYLAEGALAEWRISLKKLRRLKAHTLSANEERLLALSSSALRGHQETFSQLTNVDMRFGYLRDGSGNERELTQSSFSSFLQQRNPEVRREAFHKFYAEFRDHQFTLAASLGSSIRADVFGARARNYPSAIGAALFLDDVPLSAYDNLISTVRGRLSPLYRYLNLRKRVLGLEEIHHYDTYVPLVADVRTTVDWDGAVKTVL